MKCKHDCTYVTASDRLLLYEEYKNIRKNVRTSFLTVTLTPNETLTLSLTLNLTPFIDGHRRKIPSLFVFVQIYDASKKNNAEGKKA